MANTDEKTLAKKKGHRRERKPLNKTVWTGFIEEKAKRNLTVLVRLVSKP